MKVAICDDEQSQVEVIRLLVENAAKKCEATVDISTFLDPRTMLFETEDPKDWPDLVCVDVNMPQMLGTEAVRTMRKRGQGSAVVFFSVLSDVNILLSAFDVRATNYFVKEAIDVDRFNRVFADIHQVIDDQNQEAIVFCCAGESRNILVKEILYFEVKHHVTTVHYRGETFEFYSPLEKIAYVLEGQGFLRTHRSFLVARRFIDSVSATQVVLKNGETLPLSRTYSANVRTAVSAAE